MVRSKHVFCQKIQSLCLWNIIKSKFKYIFLFFKERQFELKNNLFYNFNDSKFEKEKLENMFECFESNSFINSQFVCDGHSDCPLSEDEENCKIHFDEKFLCRTTNKVINYKQVCNYVKDCQDGSDEEFCSNWKIIYILFVNRLLNKNLFFIFFR